MALAARGGIYCKYRRRISVRLLVHQGNSPVKSVALITQTDHARYRRHLAAGDPLELIGACLWPCITSSQLQDLDTVGKQVYLLARTSSRARAPLCRGLSCNLA